MERADYLRECFHYDADGGLLIWKERPRHHFKNDGIHKGWNVRFANTIAANKPGTNRYKSVTLDYKAHQEHRVIWEMHNGPVPKGLELDHIDGDKMNNRISNLRLVTRSQNNMNQGIRSDNKSGVRGVFWSKSKNRWMASLGKKRIGGFKSLDEAKAAYNKIAMEMYGEYIKVVTNEQGILQ